jgi:type IV pilus assembly protein PilF
LPYRPNQAAQDAADSARVKIRNLTGAGLLDAVADYRRAIALDPMWAQPRAELAYAYALAANAQQIPAAIARPEARRAALEAIRLDRRSGKAYGALGWVQSLDFDEWPLAEHSLRHALAIEPTDAQVHYWLGVHLRKKGQYASAEAEVLEALALSRQADPSYWCELAFLYWTAGQLDRMDAFMRELLVAHPNFGLTRFLNARLLKERGEFDRAVDELAFSERLQFSEVTLLAERASIEAHRGDARAAGVHLRRLSEISKEQPVDTLLIAGVYAKLGDFAAAFSWLERGYIARDTTLLSIATSPVLAPLHNDPRFASLLKRLHFEH